MDEYHQDDMKQFLSSGIVTMASRGPENRSKSFPRGLPKCRDLSTLPETNSSPLKMDGWNTSFFLGWPIFHESC